MNSPAISTILAATGDSLGDGTAERFARPTATELVKALLDAEAEARQDKPSYQFTNLLGIWNLRFITGTKVSRNGTKSLFGTGWYVPQWAKLRIIYTSRDRSEDLASELEPGAIENSVDLGAIALSLQGPCKLWSAKRLLGFDFTRARVKIFGVKVYDGFIGKGEAKEAAFDGEAFSKLPFFAFFTMTEKAIAARGRGGGIAIWHRDGESD